MSELDEEPVYLNEFCEGDGLKYFSSPKQVSLLTPKEHENSWEAQTTRIWAVAQKGENRVYDVAIVVDSRQFDIPSQLKILPDVVFAGESSDILFTIDLNNVGSFDSAQVYLLQMDDECRQKGGPGGIVEFLKDDGFFAESGDRLAQDKVFSQVLHVTSKDFGDFLEPGMRYFRVSLTATVGDETLVTYSPCTAMRVVERIDKLDCGNSQAVLQDARTLYDNALMSGMSAKEVRKWVVSYLLEQPIVAEAGANTVDDVVWVLFASGILGAVVPTEAQPTSPVSLFTPAGEELEQAEKREPRSRLIQGLTPASTVDDPGPLAQFVAETECPPFSELGPAASLRTLRRLKDAGVVFWAARGGIAFGGLSDEARAERGFATREFDAPLPAWLGWEHPGAQQIVWTGEKLDCDKLAGNYDTCMYTVQEEGIKCVNSAQEPCPSALDCVVLAQAADNAIPKGVLYDTTQADLAVGRLVLGPESVAVTPAFVKRYGEFDLDGQSVYLGFPFSLATFAMGGEFYAASADSVIGTLANVDPAAAEETGTTLMSGLVGEQKAATEVLPVAGASYGDHDIRFVGAGMVDMAFSGLINLDFGKGDLRGWEHTPEARVLSSLCDGKVTSHSKQFMGLISTGLESLAKGEVSQAFCLPKDKLLFEAHYDYISQEFMESCGQPYQDEFEMYLEDIDGENSVDLTLTPSGDKIGLDPLCEPTWGDCAQVDCGELYKYGTEEVIHEWPLKCWFDPEDNDEVPDPDPDKAYPGFAGESGWRYTGEVPLTALGLGGMEKPVRLVIRVRDEGGKKGTTTVLVDSITLK